MRYGLRCKPFFVSCSEGGLELLHAAANQPCIVQSDLTVLLETEHPLSQEAKELLFHIAELVKSPANIHTYRITTLSLWNAASAGMTSEVVIQELRRFAKWDVPAKVQQQIKLWIGRYGRLKIELHGEDLLLIAMHDSIIDEFIEERSIQTYIEKRLDSMTIRLKRHARGLMKQELTRLGYPVLDAIGFHEGKSLPFGFNRGQELSRPFALRPYQEQAVQAFKGEDGGGYGGSGVVVLPCGAGKTVVGMGVMEQFQCETLILTTNVTSVRQWKAEIMSKTSLTEEDIGEYTGSSKVVKPVTIATYQILTHRKQKADPFVHMQLFLERDWGLIVYDEVHLLPAPVFRATADIQATRRLGLTATLIREDGCEKDVFSLIGPKRYEMPWKELEHQGWIATVNCSEIRVPLYAPNQELYWRADAKSKFRIAGENPAKMDVIRRLLEQHEGKPTLIIGQYLDQLGEIAAELQAPLMTGTTPQAKRQELYDGFKRGEIPLLVVSKIANFAVDLPDAAVAIQVSGSYGSRQEEAQRLGRILRPKVGENTAYFYTLVSGDTKEQEFALKRQLFLVEQGYSYDIQNISRVTKEAAAT